MDRFSFRLFVRLIDKRRKVPGAISPEQFHHLLSRGSPPLQPAGTVVGRATPILRSAGLRMQVRAMAVSSRPAPANRSVSEISLSRLPAIAAEIGPRPRKTNISTLMAR